MSREVRISHSTDWDPFRRKPPNAPTSDAQRLVVTGFGPFQGYAVNPSGDIAEAVDNRVLSGVRVTGLRIDVAWNAAWQQIRDVVERVQPQALLSLGVAPGPDIRMEMLAKNNASPCADVRGEAPDLFELFRIVANGPIGYYTSLPAEWLRERLIERRRQLLEAHEETASVVDAQCSNDAGDYLCNFVFYQAMHFLEGIVPFRGFIHVPRYPSDGQIDRPTRDEVMASGIFLVEQLANWLANYERDLQ